MKIQHRALCFSPANTQIHKKFTGMKKDKKSSPNSLFRRNVRYWTKVYSVPCIEFFYSVWTCCN